MEVFHLDFTSRRQITLALTSTSETYFEALKDRTAVDRATIEIEAGDGAVLMVARRRDTI